MKTVRGLNTTVLEIFKAMDPERWAKEVQIHKKLADEKALAIIDEERKRFDREKSEIAQKGKEAVGLLYDDLQGYVRILLELIPFVPKAARARLIGGLDIGETPNASC